MSDELLAAAVEVTNTKSVPPIEDAFDAALVGVPRDAWLSALAVACQYRAEHPADSDEPTTPEWLAAAGGAADSYGGFVFSGRGSRPGLVIGVTGNCCMISEAGEDVVVIPPQPTRGAVRALCRALGVPLAEATP